MSGLVWFEALTMSASGSDTVMRISEAGKEGVERLGGEGVQFRVIGNEH